VFPRWENKINLFVRLDTFYLNFTDKIEIVKQYNQQAFVKRINLGKFQNTEYEMASFVNTYTPENMEEIYYRQDYNLLADTLNNLNNQTLYDSIKDDLSKQQMFVLVSFPKANDYLIKIDLEDEANKNPGKITTFNSY
jgi:hypothetical protein